MYIYIYIYIYVYRYNDKITHSLWRVVSRAVFQLSDDQHWHAVRFNYHMINYGTPFVSIAIRSTMESRSFQLPYDQLWHAVRFNYYTINYSTPFNFEAWLPFLKHVC